jgi:hypothetical protein
VKLTKLSFNNLNDKFLLSLTIALYWIFKLPRTIPSIEGDRGLFASIAERILSGDKLFVDVWYSKDPVYIWILSVGRFFSPGADILIENTWIFLASYSVYNIAKFFDSPNFISILCGFLIVPTILTGGNYYPGYTHLPGIALTFFAIFMALSRKYVISGFLVSLIFFTKIMVIPLTLPLVFYSLLLSRSKQAFKQFLIGIVFGIFSVINILYFRGELPGYLKIVHWNYNYSSGDIYPNWILPIAHILRASNTMSWSLIIIVLLIISVKYFQQESEGLIPANIRLRNFTVISFFSSLLVLSLSGMWDHHNQILYVPGVFSVLLLSKYLQTKILRKKNFSLVLGLLLAILIGGPKQGEVFVSFGEAKSRIIDLYTVSDEAQALLNKADSGSYARLGTNGLGVTTYGLRNWQLACPFLEFYPRFAKPFEEFQDLMVECIPKAQYVVVSPEFQEWLVTNPTQFSAEWSNFINSVKSTLKINFDCQKVTSILLCSNRQE